MLKALKIALLILILVFLAVLAVWSSGLLFARLRPVPAEVPAAAELEPAENVAAGGDVKITFNAVLPADRRIAEVRFEPPANVAAVREFVWKRKRWMWDRCEWSFSALIRPLASGEIAESKAVLDLVPVGKAEADKGFVIAIPEFTSGIPSAEVAGSELKLAAVMPENYRSAGSLREHFVRCKYIYIAAVILAAAAFFAAFKYFTRKAVEAELPGWELALAALAGLRDKLQRGEVLPRAGYTELMDILRDYLEIRFMLPVSRRTTAEFLAELSRPATPLPEKYRSRLAGFLQSVELIRFAKAPVSAEQLDEAAVLLSEFIKSTIPAEVERS